MKLEKAVESLTRVAEAILQRGDVVGLKAYPVSGANIDFPNAIYNLSM